MDIDLVYFWVDGSDPLWLAKKLAYTSAFDEKTQTNCKARYIGNDELKYSLRSVDKYAPWIHKIFIVTDNQIPEWLNVFHPKIKIIDHREILPSEILPCFNSTVLEYFLYCIPDLSEHFLYANDDMFFNAHLSPDFFFTKKGHPIVRLKKKNLVKFRYRFKKVFGFGIKTGHYRNMVFEAALLIEKKWGKFYSGIPHHNIDAYAKSDYQHAVQEIFKEQVKVSQLNRIRMDGDLHRSAFAFYMLAIGHGNLRYVKLKESLLIRANNPNFMRYFLRYRPLLFCLNDFQDVTDKDRTRIKPFLEKLFPEKSQFENILLQPVVN